MTEAKAATKRSAKEECAPTKLPYQAIKDQYERQRSGYSKQRRSPSRIKRRSTGATKQAYDNSCDAHKCPNANILSAQLHIGTIRLNGYLHQVGAAQSEQ